MQASAWEEEFRIINSQPHSSVSIVNFEHVHGIPSQGDGGGERGEGREQFYQALGELKFHLPQWRLSQMGGFKVLHTFFFFWGGGGRGDSKVRDSRVSLLGGWGEALPHWPKMYSSLPYHEKFPQQTPSTKFLFPAPKAHSPNYNPMKTSFLIVVIAAVPLLSYLHTLCTQRSC